MREKALGWRGGVNLKKNKIQPAAGVEMGKLCGLSKECLSGKQILNENIFTPGGFSFCNGERERKDKGNTTSLFARTNHQACQSITGKVKKKKKILLRTFIVTSSSP